MNEHSSGTRAEVPPSATDSGTVNLYLDCEWNDWCGELISMALVGEDGREWYEVAGCSFPKPWVAQNVMPHLNKPAITASALRDSLYAFLRPYESVNIIADWPEDIAHFCSVVVFNPGLRISTPDLHFHCWRGLEGVSALPHNALEDARANMLAARTTEGNARESLSDAGSGINKEVADQGSVRNATDISLLIEANALYAIQVKQLQDQLDAAIRALPVLEAAKD